MEAFGRTPTSHSTGEHASVWWVQVRACYEAGPTGLGLYRAGDSGRSRHASDGAGQDTKGRSDRVKTNRKDAELLARLLLAGR